MVVNFGYSFVYRLIFCVPKVIFFEVVVYFTDFLRTSRLHIGRLARMSVLDTEVDGSNPGSSMLCP